jgi:glycosyltransferase involved in cell wall biosynthesis
MKKFLIFELRDMCYNSCIYFADSIAEALIKLGHEVEIFRGSSDSLDGLEGFVGQSYTACLDFNSYLPKVNFDNNSLYLDRIDAPFYDFILDHPLYHHDVLKQNLKNFHVLCLDEEHKKYIQTYYPHIKSVHVLPVTGEEAVPSGSFLERNIDLLFTGTYTNPKDIQKVINNMPKPIKGDIKKLIELMLTHRELTQDGAMHILLKDSDTLAADKFHIFMHSYFLADTYVRAYMREHLVETILKADIPLTICGSKWGEFTGKKKELLHICPSIPFQDTFSLMSQSKIVLNIMPLFKKGSHDRVFSAMLNHCISLTDSSSYLEEVFIPDKNIVFYDLNNFELLPEIITDLLNQPGKMHRIAEAGYEAAKKNHTWEARAKEFLNILSF